MSTDASPKNTDHAVVISDNQIDCENSVLEETKCITLNYEPSRHIEYEKLMETVSSD